MNWEKYTLVFKEETSGEDSEWTSTRYCNVADLKDVKKGESVPFDRPNFGCPSVNFKSLSDNSLELVYHHYAGPNADTTTAYPVVLKKVGDCFSHSFYGDKYFSTYYLYLEEKK